MTAALARPFYLGDTAGIARDLLGCELVCLSAAGAASGLIVETEAYLGRQDPASHAFGGRRTRRTEVLYAPGGHAYIYLIYGLHLCLNLSTGPNEVPECVLIRALQPLTSIALMRQRRGMIPRERLAAGPGRLCRALGISKELNGSDLTGDGPLLVRPAQPVTAEGIGVSARIGVAYAGAASSWPLRFFLRGNPCLSRPETQG
jgi:DNA-3-methyladenine glycosylase